ncbi:MAG: hypothetical protein D6712_20945 [Chloroflexi bacterium]|nr:MAG: hypothetical protein D6712_20945 [Chloroflexota bacterium]
MSTKLIRKGKLPADVYDQVMGLNVRDVHAVKVAAARFGVDVRTIRRWRTLIRQNKVARGDKTLSELLEVGPEGSSVLIARKKPRESWVTTREYESILLKVAFPSARERRRFCINRGYAPC